MPDFAVLGNFVVDVIGKPLDRLPEPGRLLILDTLETHPGGNGPNTAAALALLGASVAAVGRVGDDVYGRYLRERLAGWGVETATMTCDAVAATGVTIVAVDALGERSFLHSFGANAHLVPEDVPWEKLTGARHFHLAAFFVLPGLDGGPVGAAATPAARNDPPAACRLLAEARRRGLTTSLDVCWDRTGRWMEALAPCLPLVDVLLPSEDEALALTGERDPTRMARQLRAGGVRAAVIKLGERGCFYSGPEGELNVPAFAVEVADTTGAGDCFIAGYLLGRARGWDLGRTLRFACACGARAVSAVGAVAAMAGAAEVEAWANTLPVRSETPP